MERLNYKINGLNVILIKTDKFKTTDVILNFRNYLQENNVTKRALVPYVLKAASENYPSKKAVNKQLEKLYGGSLGVSVNKQGLLHILSFRMSVVNDLYLTKDHNLLDEAFKFLNEIIFNPKIEKGAFVEKVVNDEKRLLKDHFTSLYDDKIRYSWNRLVEEMCKDEIFKIKAIGNIEDIEGITAKNLYANYLDIIESDTVDLLVIGDIDYERIKTLIVRYIQFEERDEVIHVVDQQEKEIKKLNEIEEKQSINQAKLNIGFRTYTRGTDTDYSALLIFNALFGAYPHSLLFKNVREKESLCYYISSSIDKAKGILIVYAGIDQSQYDKAVKIIFKQLKNIKEGNIDDSIIDVSRNALINDLLENQDSPGSILTSEYSYLLYKDVFDVNRLISKLNDVTKEDIVKVAQKIKEDTIFLLKGEEVSK
ncbi:MAG: peptidase [Haloplasmataceae bacterium]|jgi:predicted Zn-dependent peptidase|nr:peptidase [Haloplasmataceae bacterium]